MNDAHFESLVELGTAQEMRGWDLAWLNSRTIEEPLSWDYCQIVQATLPNAQALLDLDTGGGEILSSLFQPATPQRVPPVAWATEGYPPNISVARARLEPLGIQVTEARRPLPFEDASFDLVINRHGGTWLDEITRLLKPLGYFITQQVGGDNCAEFNQFLSAPPYTYAGHQLATLARGLEQAGLAILEAREEFPRWTFLDIAAVVFYLKIVSWQIPDFSLEAYRPKLYKLHQKIEREGGFTVHEHRLLIRAQKPPKQG